MSSSRTRTSGDRAAAVITARSARAIRRTAVGAPSGTVRAVAASTARPTVIPASSSVSETSWADGDRSDKGEPATTATASTMMAERVKQAAGQASARTAGPTRGADGS